MTEAFAELFAKYPLCDDCIRNGVSIFAVGMAASVSLMSIGVMLWCLAKSVLNLISFLLSTNKNSEKV